MKEYILKFKGTKYANQTIKAGNLGEALHRVARLTARGALPTRQVLVLPINR